LTIGLFGWINRISNACQICDYCDLITIGTLIGELVILWFFLGARKENG